MDKIYFKGAHAINSYTERIKALLEEFKSHTRFRLYDGLNDPNETAFAFLEGGE